MKSAYLFLLAILLVWLVSGESQPCAAVEATQLEISLTSDPAFLPYKVVARQVMSSRPDGLAVQTPFQVLRTGIRPGDSVLTVFATNPPITVDNPAIFSFNNLTGRHVIDDDPVRLTLGDFRLCPDAARGDTVIVGAGYRNDSAFVVKVQVAGDSVEWLFLTTGVDHTGDGRWRPVIGCVGTADYDLDGRREILFYINSERDLVPRELYSVEVESLSIEWVLPMSPGVMGKYLFPCGDSSDPGLIFTSYNAKQRVSDSLSSDSWAYVTVVDQSGGLRLHRVISAEHGGIGLIPAGASGEYFVAHSVPFHAPDDTLDFPAPVHRISRMSLKGEILASSLPLSSPMASLWPAPASAAPVVLYVLTTDGVVRGFDAQLALVTQSGRTALRGFANELTLPDRAEPVWVFGSDEGVLLVSTEFEQLAAFEGYGHYTCLIEYDSTARRSTYIMAGGGGAWSVSFEPRGFLAYAETVIWRYHVYLLGVVIVLLIALVLINHRRLTAGRKLRRREADFQAFCAASPDIVFRIDRAGVIADVQVRNERDLMWPPNVFLNRPMVGWLPAYVYVRAMESIERALDTGTMQTMEYELPVGGSVRHWELRVAPVSDNEVLAVIRDWTDRVRAEQELRESEQRFRLLFHGGRDAIVIVDVDTMQIIDVNARAEELIKRSREDLVGRPVSDIAAPEVRENFAERYKAHLEAAGTGQPISGIVFTGDGRRCPVEVSHVIIVVHGRRVIQSVIRDISERKAAEEALRQSEERLRTLVANVPAAIYRCLPDENRTMEFVSNEILAITGYEMAAFMAGGGLTYAEIVHGEDRDRMREAIADALRARQPVSVEYRLRHANGELRWVHERGQGVAGANGEVAYLDGAIYDVTEQRLATEALHESEEQMRAQYKGIPMPTYTWQRAGDDFVLIDYNDAAVAITNGGILSKIGARLSELYADNPGPRADVEACFVSQQTLRREMDYTFQTTNRSVSLVVHYVYVPPDLVMVHTEDVTEQVRSRRELATRLRYEEGLVACSLTLLQTPATEGAIKEALGHLLDALDVCRVYLYENFTDPDLGLCARQVYEVCRPDVECTLDNPMLQRVPYEPDFAAMRDHLASGQPTGGVVAEMGEAARAVNEPLGILSVLTLPVFVRGEWYGFMGFDDTRVPRRWSDEDVRLLRAAAAMVGSYLEMIEATRALAAERDFSRLLLQTANSLIACLDDEARIVVFNDELERVTGYSRSEVIGRTWHELFLPKRFHHGGLDGFGEWVRQHPTDRYERPLLTRSGEERIVLWSNSMLEDPDTGRITAIAIGHDITDRKLVEAAVIENEEKYRAVMEQSADFIYLADARTGSVFEANGALRELLGYSAEEMRGLTVFDFIDHARDDVAEKIRQVLAGELRFLRERYYRTRDGRRIPVEVGVNRVEYSGKQVLCIVSRDISARKAAEEARRQQEEKYRLLVENVRAAIILVDGEGRFLFANENAAQAVGRRAEDLVGKTQWEVFPQELADRQMENVRRVIAADREYVSEAPVYLRGEWRWFYNNLQPYRDHDGRTTAALVIAHDITAAKRAEQALKESEERFREMADLLPQTIFEVDLTGRLIYANRQGFESTGYTREDMEAGLVIDQLFPPHERESLLRNFQIRIEGGPIQRHEYTVRRKDGGTFPVLIYSARIVREGKPAGLRGVVVDITERKRAEEEVRRANQLRYQQMREIAGGVSHEIYNSLYPAVASMEKLRSLLATADSGDRVRSERLMRLTDQAVRRAIALTESVTQYARIESQRQVERVPLASLIAEIVEQNHDVGEELGVVLTVAVPSDLFVSAGKAHMYSLFNNLLVNALDAIAESATRRISVCADLAAVSMVRVVVRDSGPGIPFEIQERAFEPFFTTKPNRGTGLGLAMVKRIVESYDGQINLDSSLDSGATFTILLPGGNYT